MECVRALAAALPLRPGVVRKRREAPGRGAVAVTAAIPSGPIRHAVTAPRRADRAAREIRIGAG